MAAVTAATSPDNEERPGQMTYVSHTESPFYCHAYNTQGLKPGDLVRPRPEYVQWMSDNSGWRDVASSRRLERRYSDDPYVSEELLQVGTVIDADFKLLPQTGAIARSTISRPSLPSDPTRKITDVVLLVQFTDKCIWLSAHTLDRIGPYIP